MAPPETRDGRERTPAEHVLKCWPLPFEQVLMGTKRHEVRVFDRAYAEYDRVTLCEWRPDVEDYTGRRVTFTIGHVSQPGTWGLPANVGVFSLLGDPRMDYDFAARDREEARSQPQEAR